MAYEPLHHKYRPQTFAELVGQEAITTTLTNALRQQKIASAYLFTGARGTGKTSSARILAKSLNCLQSSVPTEKPCGICEVCQSITRGNALDVVEIDAASNTGVDNIRELIERAQFAPVQCRYKVYVLDEVHMLTGQAFNALLKTLEEPPSRVVFVLATTDPQRVLPTIISRCQRFDFRRIELGAMVQHLSDIAAQESIDITSDAIELVAQIAQGGLRDAESMLDQLSLLEQQITIERVWDLVGAVPERDLLALVQAIAQNDSTRVIEQVRHLMDRGREPLIVLQNLASFYRDLLIAKTTPTRQDLVAITPPTWAEMTDFVQNLDLSALLRGQQHLRSSEVQVKNTTQPRLWLEVTLLGLLPAVINGLAAKPQDLRLGTGMTAPAHITSIPQNTATNGTKPEKLPAPPLEKPACSELSHPEPAVTAAPIKEPVVEADVSVVQPPVAAPLELSAPVQPEASLDQCWQEVLQVLQPPGTQALFKQQGCLLSLTETSAKVGISSQPLFKMAQLRVANLEAALAQVTQQAIRVSLEVVAVPVSTADAPTEDAPVDSPAASLGGGTRSSFAPTPVSVVPAFSPRPAAKASATNGNSSTAEAAHSYQSEPLGKPSPAVVPSAPPTAPQWQDEDEVGRAAKSLAQMFNGQIVSCDDEPSAVSPGTALRQMAEQPEDGDPDGDVPF